MAVSALKAGAFDYVLKDASGHFVPLAACRPQQRRRGDAAATRKGKCRSRVA